MGYYRAGFDVYGVDIKDQPGYPFRFAKADALSFPLQGFDVIHASPPCQRWAEGTRVRDRHPDLITPLRARLEDAGVPWVLENVTAAPLRMDVMLCGSHFDLPGLIRHRIFETSWGAVGTMQCRHRGAPVTVTGKGLPSGSPYYSTRATVTVVGHDIPHNSAHKGVDAAAWRKLREEAMDIGWMTNRELSEAIPPAYTQWMGGRLMELLGHA